MENFSWSWSPLKLLKVVERDYGDIYHVKFPSIELIRELYPVARIAASELPATFLIKGDDMKSAYANDRLFPYYEGIMLQVDSKPISKTVTLTGSFNEIEVKGKRGEPSKWYCEFLLSDSSKKIKLSKVVYTQLFALVSGDIDKLSGFKVVLTTEFGRWFKKKNEKGTWALRVNLDETAKLNGVSPLRYE